VLVVVLAACAPTVDGPVEQARERDRTEERRLEQQLAALPGVRSATVALDRPVRDPLSLAAPAPPRASAALVIDAAADRARLESGARAIVATSGVEPAIEVTPLGRAPESRGASHGEKVLLVASFAAIAILAALLAQAYRRGRSAQ